MNLGYIYFFNWLNNIFTMRMTIIFEMAIKKHVKFFRLFHFTKVLTKPSLKGSASLSNISHATINFSSKIVSEYDQEIPQSQTADNPVAPRGRAAQPSRDTRKTN